ncbi:MAG: hypothetical protein WCK65_06960 [Rhodospirillaceae bacterium]
MIDHFQGDAEMIPAKNKPLPASLSGLDGGGGPPHSSGMEQRLAKIEGAYESLKVVRPMMFAVLGIVTPVIIGILVLLETQILSLRTEMIAGFAAIRAEMRDDRAATRADFMALRTEMRDDRAATQAAMREERLATQAAMRDERAVFQAAVAAQVGAIANVITVTRQQAPQVIIVPAPVIPQPQTP